jgi:uncharacterized membrane protein
VDDGWHGKECKGIAKKAADIMEALEKGMLFYDLFGRLILSCLFLVVGFMRLLSQLSPAANVSWPHLWPSLMWLALVPTPTRNIYSYLRGSL